MCGKEGVSEDTSWIAGQGNRALRWVVMGGPHRKLRPRLQGASIAAHRRDPRVRYAVEAHAPAPPAPGASCDSHLVASRASALGGGGGREMGGTTGLWGCR